MLNPYEILLLWWRIWFMILSFDMNQNSSIFLTFGSLILDHLILLIFDIVVASCFILIWLSNFGRNY